MARERRNARKIRTEESGRPWRKSGLPRGTRVFAILLASLFAGTITRLEAVPRRRARHANSAAEVTALARVEKKPRRTTHRNGRSFEQLQVLLLSVDPRRPASGEFEFDTRSPVKIVHDLTCGGTWLELSPGDLVDLRGEYVHTPDGHDLIHFTHPADGRCGRAAGHPDGFFRVHRSPAAAGAPSPRLDDPARVVAMFQSTVRPILTSHCAPCHETGGQMYGRLPFDDPGTVAAHSAKMMRRLKSDEERRALETWAARAGSLPPRAEKKPGA